MSDSIKRTVWNFFSGSQVTFGPRAIAALGSVVKRRCAKRILLISDGVLERAGIVPIVQQVLKETPAEHELFLVGEVGASTETIEEVAGVARAFQPDLFVGVGGASNMDVAKVCSAVYGHDCQTESLFGFNNVPGPVTPVVCVPTTAGTGGEVSHSASLKVSSNGQRAVVLSEFIRPTVAIVDPYLTVTCPQHATAENGIDALTKAIEAYLVSNFYTFDEPETGLPYEGNNPFGDMFAEKAIELIGRHLKQAFDEPEYLAARSGMALAATLAGIASSNCGVGLAQALADSVGTASGCSRGTGQGLVLPEVMRYHKLHRAKRLAKTGELLGVDCTGVPADEAADRAVQRVVDIRASIALPRTLREIGVEREQLPRLAELARSQQLIDLTPGSPTRVETRSILERCFE